LSDGAAQSTNQQQVVTFVEDTPSVEQTFQPISDPTFTNDHIPSADLAQFLERPVLISTQRWTEGTPYSASSIAPWHLYFTNAVIKKKIDNYAFINCNLHIKLVINASPFYFGAKLVSYRPLTTFGLDEAFGTDGKSFVTHSQRPHFWVLPQTNTGGDLELPFFYLHNWLNLTNTTQLTQMGRLDFQEVAALLNSNGVSGAGIDIQVYAWATNVKLSGPTCELQSGRRRPIMSATSEYTQGPVEKVASTVADIAGRLVDAPVIGIFAKATEYGAKAMAGISALFGWTNVPVISNVQPFKNVPFHAFSSSEIGTPVEKLTLDPKNELTIDPRTVGLQGADEMSINYLVGRESYLTQFVWSETQAAGDLLFLTRVSPTMHLVGGAVTGGSTLALTPMAMVGNLFNYWRGDIIYRFKAICTQFHRGRLRITWDPIGDLSSVSDTTATSFTKIVDLAPDMDVEIRVSYLQQAAFLSITDPVTQQWQLSDFSLTPRADFDNGTLSVRVLNDLTGPIAGAVATVLVFVRGGDNMMFSNPRTPWGETHNKRVSTFELQSGVIEDKSSTHDGYLPSVFGGEAIRSIRPLLRRTNLTRILPLRSFSTNSTATAQIITYDFTKMPHTVGYDPAASTVADSVTTGSVQYAYGRNSPLVCMLPCYLGYRGSMMIHLNVHSNGRTAMTMHVSRREAQVPLSTSIYVPIVSTSVTGTTDSSLELAFNNPFPAGSGGSTLTNQQTQSGLSILCPHYFPVRMNDTNPVNWLKGVVTDFSIYKSYRLLLYCSPLEDNNYLANTFIERYQSIGPDFNAFFFLNVPVHYLKSADPVIS
jgi:hypothetical protein